jgi:hypothetical protein
VSLERDQIAEPAAIGLLVIRAAREQPAQLGIDAARLVDRAGRDHRGQQRCRGDRDGDAAALDAQLQRDAVAAQRVVDTRLVCRRRERAGVSRVRVVLEDDVLVELLERRVHPDALRKIRATRSSDSTSASSSRRYDRKLWIVEPVTPAAYLPA